MPYSGFMEHEKHHKKINRPKNRNYSMFEFMNFLNAMIAYTFAAAVLVTLMILF